MRVVTCDVLALQRIGSHHERACTWRLAQDGIAQLTCLGMKRQLACKRSLLRRILVERELTLAEVRAAVAAGEAVGLEALIDPSAEEAGGLLPGSLALTLLPEGDSLQIPFAISAILSEEALGLQITPKESVALMEDLCGQPSVDEILSGSLPAGGDTEDINVAPNSADVEDPGEDEAEAEA
mmetsp:Transcript_31709/g.50992  ORF Transcript_31709/g.50992 Transcript_31709/m.50992 type:complete len:182 (-) Transcript_31709:45-590(-)